MAYEKYKELRSKDEFFAEWTAEGIESTNEATKNKAYNDYFVRVLMFQRDNFTCQNKDCTYCHNVPEYEKLEMHHYRARRNKGKTSLRNCVTVCSGSHNAHNRGKKAFVFDKEANLPTHIRGNIQQLDITKKVNWKAKKQEGQVIRKNNKEFHGLTISWELMRLLIKFLELEIED